MTLLRLEKNTTLSSSGSVYIHEPIRFPAYTIKIVTHILFNHASLVPSLGVLSR